jgi:hypothetical protein
LHGLLSAPALLASGSALLLQERAQAALREMKITRIRHYRSPITRPIFNQSFDVVTVETDAGLIGIGKAAARTRFASAGKC